MQGLALGGMLFAADLVRSGAHFAVTADRSAAMCKDVDDAAVDLTPILGVMETAGPAAVTRFTTAVKELPAASRALAAHRRLLRRLAG